MTLGTFWARSGTKTQCSITTRRRDSSLTSANAVERVTRIELAWPAWKESARLLEPTRMRLLV
jgi:hypothetical protein